MNECDEEKEGMSKVGEKERMYMSSLKSRVG